MGIHGFKKLPINMIYLILSYITAWCQYNIGLFLCFFEPIYLVGNMFVSSRWNGEDKRQDAR